MKRIWAVCKKELKKFFTDYRMLLALILPGITIFVLYSIMGSLFGPDKITEVDKGYQFKVAVSQNYSINVEEPCKLEGLINYVIDSEKYENEPTYTYFPIADKDEYQAKLKNNEIDSLIIFDDNFEDVIFGSVKPEKKPNVNILYNSESKESEVFFNYVAASANQLYSSFSLNGTISSPNVGERSNIMGQIMGMILPMLTISLLYGVTMTICPESIAGEKERGTLASILITPIKRSEFAIGKILSLIIVAIFGGTISCVGMIASLPKMFAGADMVPITGGAYALLFLVFITLVLVFVNIAATISTYAKSTKEATGFLGPLMAIFMLASMLPGFVDCSNIGFAFIPILNCSQLFYAIINGQYDILYLGMTVLSNIVFSAILILIDIKLFKTESVVLRQ